MNIHQLAKVARRVIHEPLKETVYIVSSETRPRKLTFDHLPKCGGSSLNHFLESNYPWRKTFTTDGSNPVPSLRRFEGFPESRRFGFDLVKGHLANELFDFLHPDSLKVTVLRDPVDRIVSHYFYVKRRPTHYLYETISKSNMTLGEFVTIPENQELENWYASHFSGMSQEEVRESPSVALSRAVQRLTESFDLVGTLEDFGNFVQQLETAARLRVRYKSVRKNVTKNRPQVSDLDQATRAILESANSVDIALYDRVREMKSKKVV